jgi:hypothetical protein
VKPEKVKILITVKTYPTISKKYGELSCTAGVKEDGSWIRIYPIPFRLLEFTKRYKKYQWLEVQVIKNTSDHRPESHRIFNWDDIKLLDIIDTKNKWHERKKIILEKCKVFNDMETIIKEAKENNSHSLCVFKPAKINDFIIEPSEREWPKNILEIVEDQKRQGDLFSDKEKDEILSTYKIVKKLPYKFSYKFADINSRESTMMIEDWEIGQLYWNSLRSCNGNEKRAIYKVKQKYLDEFSKKDIYLYLGTTRQFHSIAKNPFVVVGVFYPPL